MTNLQLPHSFELKCNQKRARFIFRVRSEKAYENDEQLSATQAYGVISQKKYMDLKGGKVMAALAGTENFLHANEDDFVISLRTFEGGIERVREDGCISPAYTVLKPIENINPNYFEHLLKSHVFVSHLQTTVTGIRDGKSVKYENFANIKLAYPDLPTQRAIADFLDRETVRIDQLIEKKEKMVEVLGEKKQGMHAAIFNGEIYSNSFIQTNLPFLTRIPEDWEISKFSRYFKIRMGETILSEALLDSGKYAVFSATQGDHYFGYVNETKAPLNSGDIVVPARGSIGNVKYVTEPSTSTQTTIQVSSISNIIDTRYAYYFMRTFKNSLFEYDRTAIPQITTNQVGRNPIIIPSKLLQEDIVKRASDLDAVIQPIINLVHESVEHLREYRSSLITAAVTGQIDVNNWLQSGAGDRRLDAMQERLPA